MKKRMIKLMVGSALVLGAAPALAANCVPGSFASYIALGSAGCQIGSTTFSDFASFGNPSAASPIATSSITFVPQNISATSIGFDYLFNISATAGQFKDILLGYRLQGATYTGDSVFLTGAQISGDGSVTAITDACRNGTFSSAGPGSCSGSAVPPLLVINSGSDSQSFAAAAMLSVITDVGVDAGATGTASLVSAGNRFNVSAVAAIPEPSTYGMLLGGLLGLGFVRRKARKSAATTS